MNSSPAITPCRSWCKSVGRLLLVTMAAMTLNPLVVLAQDDGPAARIKPGDILELTVPGRPDLSAEMTVGVDGNVNVPEVGEVGVAGLDVEAATLVLKQKIRLFVPTLDSLQLEVTTSSGTPRIYVIGRVVKPGAHNFLEVPTLWDVLRAAGGPTDSADLRDARIIREEGDLPTVHPVDLSGYLEGTEVMAFELRDGDTLVLPALAEGVSGVPSKDGVKVFGSVGAPMVVALRNPMPLLDVLMLAGAPTETAELEKVYWVHEDGGKILSTQVSVMSYLMLGDPLGNPMVYPGDTLKVEYAKPSWVRANLPFILGSLAAVATILLAYDNLTRPD